MVQNRIPDPMAGYLTYELSEALGKLTPQQRAAIARIVEHHFIANRPLSELLHGDNRICSEIVYYRKGTIDPDTGEARRVWADELVPVASCRMLSELPELFSPADLGRYPLVLRHESSSSRSSVDQALRTYGIEPADCNVVLEVSGNEALKRAVAAGAGIGFISRRAIENELASGALVVVKSKGLSITRHFYALHHKNQELPVAEALWNYLLAAAAAERELPDKLG